MAPPPPFRRDGARASAFRHAMLTVRLEEEARERDLEAALRRFYLARTPPFPPAAPTVHPPVTGIQVIWVAACVA